LTEAAKSGKGNLMELSVLAAKLRATVGEISFALEKVYGRHVAKDSIVRGAYSKESMEKTND
jgi:methylmalonyl-CoA mutase